MATYKIVCRKAVVDHMGATLFRVGFGDPAGSDRIVQDVHALMFGLSRGKHLGAKLALINGPISAPVAVVLAQHLLHRFGAVAVYDTKLAAYVVCAAKGTHYPIGTVIPASAVFELEDCASKTPASV